MAERKVPKLQTTIGALGQFAPGKKRAVQQPVPRIKALEAAEALKGFNQALEKYSQLADVDAAMYEEELASRSPEEIEAGLKRTETELDKQVRQGTIGWLTSPLNKKRKKQAEGRLASRSLVAEIESRLINPLADDPEDLTERANLVRQEFIEKTPLLNTSIFAQEGLNQASTARIQEMVGNYKRRESVLAKNETVFGIKSVMYDKIHNLTKANETRDAVRKGDFSFLVEEKDLDGDGVLETTLTFDEELRAIWEDTGSLSATEQRALFKSLVEDLAQHDMEDQAEGLLVWAERNLNFGATKMSDMEYNDYMIQIDRAAEIAEDQRRRDSIELTRNTIAEFKVAYDDIQFQGSGTYAGKNYTDKNTLFNEAMEIPPQGLDNVSEAEFRDEIKNWTARNYDPEERKANELIAKTTGISELVGLFEKELGVVLKDNAFDSLVLGDFNTFYAESINSLNTQLRNKARQLNSNSNLTKDARGVELLSFTSEAIKRERKEFNDKVEKRQKVAAEQEKNNRTVESFLNTKNDEPLGPKWYDRLGFRTNKSAVDYTTMVHNVRVMASKTAPKENKDLAFKYFTSDLPKYEEELLKRLEPNATKEKYDVVSFDPSERGRVIEGEPYTESEKSVYRQQLTLIYGFTDKFTNIETLSNGVTQDGLIRFDPEDLGGRARMTRILTTEEIQEALDIKNNEDMPESIKKKAELIGVTDLVEFVKNQKEFSDRLGITRITAKPDTIKPAQEREKPVRAEVSKEDREIRDEIDGLQKELDQLDVLDLPSLPQQELSRKYNKYKNKAGLIMETEMPSDVLMQYRRDRGDSRTLRRDIEERIKNLNSQLR